MSENVKRGTQIRGCWGQIEQPVKFVSPVATKLKVVLMASSEIDDRAVCCSDGLGSLKMLWFD
jgi:hypothetical protein